MKTMERAPQSIPILAYHALVRRHETALPKGWSRQHAVSHSSFRAQLRFLQETGWATVGLEAIGGSHKPDVRQCVAITFDDGHASDTFAANTLGERGFTATFFIPCSHIGRTGYLERPAILDLVKGGFRIGSHGLEHAPLTGKDRLELECELSESKQRLEDLTGTEISDLAVPFGRYDRQVLAAAISTGYQRIVTSDVGIARVGKGSVLPRLPVTASTTLGEFGLQLAPGPVTMIWQRIRHAAKHRLYRVKEIVVRPTQ